MHTFVFLLFYTFNVWYVLSIGSQIPIIDFRPFIFGSKQDKSDVVSEIKSSLQNVGFFLIKNHGISKCLIDDGFRLEQDFFRQNIAEKEKYKKKLDYNFSHPVDGWYKNELVYGSTADIKETYDILLDNILDKQYDDMLWFNKQNRSYNFFELMLSMKLVSQYMMEAISLALNGPQHFLSDIHNNFHQSYIRFVYYNANDNNHTDNDNTLMLQPHTDFLSLTMGFQDEAGGLEVWDKLNKKWIDLPYIADTMIVNIGDALQRWSNDRLISNFHRVKNIQNNKTERFSYYIFIGPKMEQIIDAKDFGVKEEDMIYKPSTFGDYFIERQKNTFKDVERDDQFTGDPDALCDSQTC